MLGRYRIAPDNLELEITENTLLDRGSDKIARALSGLKQLGVKIALDDFGTGYASLVHLKRFSVDRLKIDRSFVSDIETSQDSSVISRAIISLAHSLGLKVVAEGVGTEEQVTFLRAEGCDFAQGYFFGRPLEGAALIDYVNAIGAGNVVMHGEPSAPGRITGGVRRTKAASD
jgi:EAL domain-containing protein (putative c-di-GMP-specific phosphodiesterase class I)